MNESIDLSKQIVLVTGGGRGIGQQIAKRLSQAGATVVIAARTMSQLDETVDHITSKGASVSPLN